MSRRCVGVRTGIGNAVAELIASFANLEAAPTLVPYALSLRAREHRSELPPDTRFPPIPARALLASWGRSDAPKLDFWLRPGPGAARDQLPRAAEPAAGDRDDQRLLVRPVSGAVHARGPGAAARRAALDPSGRGRPRAVRVRRRPRSTTCSVPGLIGTGRLVVVPWGVPPINTGSETPPELREIVDGPPYVLAIGSLEPRKNLPYLVAAFGAVADSHPDLRLVLAGPDGPARPAVDAAIAELSPSARTRVVITGGVSDAGRVALLEHAHVLAYPSLYEGFGFPVLEAMSIGVPVVAARAGSIPEVAGDAATLVGATDVRALAEALIALVDDDASAPSRWRWAATRPAASRGSRPRTASRRSTGAWPTRDGLARDALVRVALHTGQLLQPVPGGIGRYARAMMRHLPADGRRPHRVRRGRAAERSCRRRCRTSISVGRTAACATRRGTGSGGRD